MSAITPTMMLINSPWNGKKSFKAIPVHKDCPYTEFLYDSDSKIMVVITTTVKDSMHVVPRLDENGDPVKTKTPRPNGKTYKEARIQIETFTEHYITEKEDMEQLINMHVVNASSFDWKKYVNDTGIITPEQPKIQLINQ